MEGRSRAAGVSGWTVGFAVFAGVMLTLVGVFHALAGLAAIIDDEYFVVGVNYAYEFDTTAWGWIHLIAGVIVIAAGYGVFSGASVGPGRRDHAGVSQRDRELLLHPVPAGLGDPDHRAGRARDRRPGGIRSRGSGGQIAAARLLYVGHATVLIELDGVRLLTDPVLRSRVAHLRRRVPLETAGLAGVDATLLSHVHYDHLDRPSLRLLGSGRHRGRSERSTPASAWLRRRARGGR